MKALFEKEATGKMDEMDSIIKRGENEPEETKKEEQSREEE